MTTGIYKLNFKGTDKVYIEQSNNIEYRFKSHLNSLSKGLSNFKMLEAYHKYGPPTLEIICECEQDDLNKTEDEAIEIFDSVNTGLNINESSQEKFCGEENGQAKHTNDEIITAFNRLVDSPELSFAEVAIITGVNTRILQRISSSIYHLWLKDLFPEKYKKLQELKGNRRNNGEFNSQSKYTKEQIILVFNLLVEHPEKSYKELSEISLVPPSLIGSISSSNSHTWLEDIYPEKYLYLKKLKGTRNKGCSSSTAKYPRESIIQVLHLLVEIPLKTIEEVSLLTKVSEGVVSNIRSLKTHLWLEKELPIEYSRLKSLKGLKRKKTGI